jgi:hypothetical protein
MADLFIKTTPTINEHIINIFKEGELEENTVIRKFRITAADSKKYSTNIPVSKKKPPISYTLWLRIIPL